MKKYEVKNNWCVPGGVYFNLVLVKRVENCVHSPNPQTCSKVGYVEIFDKSTIFPLTFIIKVK